MIVDKGGIVSFKCIIIISKAGGGKKLHIFGDVVEISK